MRLGVPDHLSTPSFQVSSEDVLVIVHPQTGVPSLSLDQVRSIFLGQVVNWKDVGGNDLPVQVWSFSADEDVQGIFSQAVMNWQPITSLARLAVSDESMAEAVEKNPGSVGILPRRLMTSALQSVFTAAKAPVLIITKSTPKGAIEDLISCLQQEGH
jgi:phosphate transport system substrate-binding protein